MPDVVVANQAGLVSTLLAVADGGLSPGPQVTLTASDPTELCLGDFDGDGIVDLGVSATANAGTTTRLEVLFGDGRGAFGNETVVTDQGNSQMACGDFNGDGIADMVVVYTIPSSGVPQSTESAYLGSRQRTFSDVVGGSASYGSVAVDDLNSDGVLDVVLGPTYWSQGMVLWGNGDGTFRGDTLPLGNGCTGVIVGDFNADGHPDLVCGATTLLGWGDGGFLSKANGLNGAGLAAADVNGDGQLDMLGPGFTTGMEYSLGNGDGTFSNQDLVFPGHDGNDAVLIADFDRNGRVDLAILNSVSSDISVLLSGAALPPTLPPVCTADAGFTDPVQIVSLTNAYVVTSADMNQDGLLDMLAVGLPGLAVILNQGDGGWALAAVHVGPDELTADSTHFIVAGDLNEDGLPDVVATRDPPYTTPPGAVVVLLGEPDAGFGAPTPFAAASSLASPVVVDVNHDGHLDVVVVDGNGAVEVFAGDGTGGLAGPVIVAAMAGNLLAVADLRSQGSADLLSLSAAGLYVSLQIADGGWAPASTYTVDNQAGGLAVGDLNHDGHIDAVVGAGGSLDVFLGRGDGTFGARTAYPVASEVSVALGDVNGDGNLDAISSTSYYGRMWSVTFGDGTGAFRDPITKFSAGFGWDLYVQDFNGDGYADVALSGTSTLPGVDIAYGGCGERPWTAAPPAGVVHGSPHCTLPASCGGTCCGGGAGVYLPWSETDLFAAPTQLFAVDANGDGRADLLLNTPMTLLLGDGTGRFADAGQLSSMGTALEVVDFDGDGRSDVLSLGASVQVFPGQGDGGFGAPVAFEAIQGTLAVSGRLGGSGPGLDLVVTPGSNLVDGGEALLEVYLNVDGGLVDTTSLGSFLPGSYVSSIGRGDFDGDGRTDLVAIVDGQPNIYLGLGAGQFGQPTVVSTFAPNTSFIPYRVSAADLDLDGLADLVMTDGENVAVMLSRPDGGAAFSPIDIYPDPVSQPIVADVNADGYPDVLGASWVGSVYVMLAKGGGLFQPPVMYMDAPEGQYVALTVGDFNGDGRLDIATARAADEELVVLLGY